MKFRGPDGSRKIKKAVWKIPHRPTSVISFLCTFYFAGFETGSANIHSLGGLANLYADRLNISFPHLVGSSVGMADVISEMSALSAYCTLCHNRTSLYILMLVLRIIRNDTRCLLLLQEEIV